MTSSARAISVKGMLAPSILTSYNAVSRACELIITSPLREISWTRRMHRADGHMTLPYHLAFLFLQFPFEFAIYPFDVTFRIPLISRRGQAVKFNRSART